MMIDIEAEYRKIKFNSGNLTEIIEDQASQHGEFCKNFVRCKSIRDGLEVKMEQVFAKLAGGYRAKALEDTGKLPTEAPVKQAVLGMEEYQKLQKRWLEVKEETRHWDVLRESSNQRSFMIGHVVELHLKGLLQKRSVNSGRSSATSSEEDEYDKNREKRAEQRSNLRRARF